MSAYKTGPQVSPAFEIDRLWSHYVWIFIIQFSTILIYLATFCSLRSKTRKLMLDDETLENSPTASTIKSVNRVATLMMLYPLIYIVLTLPLSAGECSHPRALQETGTD